MLRILGEIEPSRLNNVESADLVIAACGYESRASAFAQRFPFESAQRVALLFDQQRVLAFSRNRELFVQRGYTLSDVTDATVMDSVLQMIDAARKRRSEGPTTTVFVDISSQSRSRLAAIVEAVSISGQSAPLRVLFGYSPAEYSDPPSSQIPNVSIGPVTPFFAGWARDPEKPISLILGLGYEPDRGLGAVEYLEPASIWPLLPHSQETRYDESLLHANAPLLEEIGTDQLIRYEVEDPNATLAVMASLIGHLSRNSVVLMLPSGPKILVLLSLLLACGRRDVGVWRVSAGANELAADRKATNRFLVVECVFEPEVTPKRKVAGALLTEPEGGTDPEFATL
jgi:hypothetical protein